MNKKYTVLALLTFLYFVCVFVLEIYFLNSENNFFWCITSNYFEEINSFLPIHCDEGPYQLASQNIEYFFSENNPYQKRPLYIISIFIARNIVGFLTFGIFNEYIEFRIAMLIIQCLILYLIGINSIKFFKINKLSFYNISIILLIFSIPNIRWNLFFPSHGNITLLLLLFSLNKLEEINYSNQSNMEGFFTVLGLASMFHRSAIFYGLIVILIAIIFYSEKIIKGLLYLLIIMIPTTIYELFFIFTSFKSFDWNREVYGQFYWILDLLLGKQNNYHDSSCQTFDTFINCNFEVTISFVKYFIVGIIFMIILLLKNNEVIKDKTFQNLFSISFLIYIIWSFQGLYPNFRFVNYSIGYFLFISIIYICSIYKKNIFLNLSILVYEFSIIYLEVYSITYFKPNNLTYLAIVIFTISIFYKTKTLHKAT